MIDDNRPWLQRRRNLVDQSIDRRIVLHHDVDAIGVRGSRGAGVAATLAPSASSACALAAVRFQTVTCVPPLRKRRTMPDPAVRSRVTRFVPLTPPALIMARLA